MQSKWLLIALIYIATVYSAFLTLFNGGLTSHYWAGFNITLTAWFFLIPLSFSALVINGGIQAALYNITVLGLSSGLGTQVDSIIEYNAYVGGTLVLGFAGAWLRNYSAALDFIQKETIEELGNLDPLTQLFNRRYISEWLETKWPSLMESGVSLSVMVIDLDHFKS